MKIAIAQMNPIVGDLENNCQAILNICHRAAEFSADLVLFPELSLSGYPPKDLLLRDDFLRAQARALDEIAKRTPVPAIVGAAVKHEAASPPFNAAVMCKHGRWDIVAAKRLLPNYNVFDEKRYFGTPKEKACQVITINGLKVLLSICEDAWNSISVDGELKYDFDPIANAVKLHGPVDFILNMSASPFSASKPKIRERIFRNLAKTHRAPVLVAGQVGANDQLLFDGHSLVVDANGHIIKQAKACVEELLIYDSQASPSAGAEARRMDDDDLLMAVLTMGIRDYVEKCRMPGVLIGLSGGIDSAVCASLAVKALGKARVRAVFLPSRFSSEQSLTDAKTLAHHLGIRFDIFSIEEPTATLRGLLSQEFTNCSESSADIADQNIQSRLRGLLIMALSNATDYLMMATSNKSELAVGYSTTYGDMCGAFSAIGDLYKTQVWQLAKTINKQGTIIPQAIIDKLPTAELKPNQLDSDTLPEYAVLDKILVNFIDLEKSAGEIEDITKLSRPLIERVIGMVNRSEYKRRQGPFCLMVSDKVFGDARRLPIAKRMDILD